MRAAHLTFRQILGALLICALLAGTAAWAAAGRPAPDLPAIGSEQPPTPMARPLGTLEPWAQELAAQTARRGGAPPSITVAGVRARVERLGDDAIVCPAATGGCVLLRPRLGHFITAYGADARARLRARTKTS